MSSSTNRKRKAEEMEEDKDIIINEVGPVRYMRDAPPAHYTFKIESFSLLSDTEVERYECGNFDSGGYKWRLSIYPNGDDSRKGDGHTSLYLSIIDSDAFPLGWEVLVNYKFFVFNIMMDKYLTIQDDYGAIRRFRSTKTEWGFAQLLSLDTFKKASNGYLVNDSCMFGAEVFVIKCSGKWECLSMVKEPANSTYTWKINKFSTLTNKCHYSQVFPVGNSSWKLKVYPKGNFAEKGKYLSLYLELNDLEILLSRRKLYAEFVIRIKDQLNDSHFELGAKHWFCAAAEDFGFTRFISLSELNQASMGFCKNDTVILEAQISTMSEIKDFP